MKDKLHCIRCDKGLDDISTYQPNDGLCFVSSGHYGSTFFDPLDGSYLEIVVCDECLKTAKTIRTVEPQPEKEPVIQPNDWELIESVLSNPEAWKFD